MQQIGELVVHRAALFGKTDWSVREVARFMTEKKIGAVPVLEGAHLVGIFSERDLMSRVVAVGKNPDQVKLIEVMTREVISAHPSDSPQTCLRKMQQAKCRHLPVVKDGKLLGTISLRELMQVDLAEKDHEIQEMTHYITGS